MAKTIKSIDGVDINADLRAIEQAMGLLEARIDVAHPVLNGPIFKAFITLDRAYQDIVDRLADAAVSQLNS